MLITFSGLDGSGKSTQAQIAQKYLLKQGYQATLLHMTRWTWVNRLGESFSKHRISKNRHSPSNLNKTALRLSRLIMMFIDIARFWMLWLCSKVNGRVLVCDRYFYDLGIQAIYMRAMSFRLLKLYWLLTPRPTVAFWLEVQSKVAQQREGEHQADYYQDKAYLYRHIVARHSGVQVVPAISLSETKSVVIALIQQRIENIYNP